MIFDILFLPVLFFIAAITCYEDFKYGKVRNKWILLGIFWGVIVVVFFVAWYFIASPVTRFYYLNVLNFSPDSPMPVFTVNPSYLGTVLWNFLVAFVVAFLMWRFGAWAAGDAKLFAVFAFLLPLKYYWKTYFSYFPSFVLLSNIFLLIFLYLLFRSCFFSFKSLPFLISGLRKNFKKQGIWEKVSEKFSWSKLKKRLRSIPCFIWIFLILGLFQNTIEDYLLINVLSLQILIFGSFVLFNKFWSDVFQKPVIFRVIIFFFILTFGYGLIFSWVLTWQILFQSIMMLVIFMTVFTLLGKVIDFYVSQTSISKIKIESLKAKMNLTEDVINEIKKDEKLYNNQIGQFYTDGLTQEQVDIIKERARKNKNFSKTISIYKPFPFVVWMFIGLIATMFLKGSMVSFFIKNIFSG